MLRINVYQDHAGEWRWQMYAANNRVIADSGEGYATEYNAVRAAHRLRELAPVTPIYNSAGEPYASTQASMLGPPDLF